MNRFREVDQVITQGTERSFNISVVGFNEVHAPVFDVQKFSVHDGSGIRTLIFLKGCLLSCLWCSNPEGQSGGRQLMFFPEKCIGCGKCLKVCEHGAISDKGGGLHYERKMCKVCEKCTEVCPSAARKIIGKEVTVDNLIREIEKDILFYKNSGGGITFGGGEPLLYPDFVKAVSFECQKRDIHVAVETCGYYPWANLERVIKHVDLVMFDLKHMDADVHKKLCGHSNELILDNLATLCKSVNSRLTDTKIVVRVPVIPELNDSDENIHNTAECVFSLGNAIIRIELLPYHKFGVKKYERLGMRYQLEETEVPSDERMQAILRVFKQYGLNVQIGG